MKRVTLDCLASSGHGAEGKEAEWRESAKMGTSDTPAAQRVYKHGDEGGEVH